MILAIVFALVLAKTKKYSLKPLLTAYALYPFAFLTLILIFFQASIFLHNYEWIKYAAASKSAYLVSLIIPFLIYKLYKPGLCGAALILFGTLLNKIAISQNSGKMPVYATLSKLTGYFNESVIGAADTLHSIGDSSTKVKFLTDFIDIGYSVLSVGDLMIHSFVLIILFYTIGALNSKSAVMLQNNI